MNRRKFLIQTGAAAAGYVAASTLTGCATLGDSTARSASGQRVTIISDPADPVAASQPAKWAALQLLQTLTKQGFSTRIVGQLDEAHPGDLCLVAGGRKSTMIRDGGFVPADTAESLAIAPGRLGSREVLFVGGSDARGLVYALTEIADRVALSDDPLAALRPMDATNEKPANKVRSVMRMFVSDVEDKAWYNDRDFWRSYLTMLASQRFNRFNLAFGLSYDGPTGLLDTYLYFAYPFLLPVPGYDVRASNLPDAERDGNLAMLRFISDEAAARGLQFQLGLWTHAYAWTNSPKANHVISGLTPQTQAPYSRDALEIILKECPNITGVTFRIHGESGVPEGSYDLWKTIFDGCVRSGRPIEIDMHAKGMDQPTLDVAMGTGLPVVVSPKFWAEHLGLPYHQAAIRQKEMPTRARGNGAFAQSSGARSFLRYGYGDLLTEDRKYGILHRIWPGTQRVLLSGDPTYVAGYSRAGSFCGSLGHEIFDPLSFKGRKGSGLPGFRDGYADASLRAPGGDFEKYRYPFRVWGQLLYNPAATPDVWQRQLRQDYGAAARAAETSLANASRILPLITTTHMPAAANNNYWPEMYENMSIVDAASIDTQKPTPYGPSETPSPIRFGTVSPLDPQLFSRIEDYVDELLKDSVGEKYSPVEVAQSLEVLAWTATDTLAQATAHSPDPAAPAFRRFAIDVQVQAGLGNFFGKKFRAAMLYAIYDRTGDTTALDAALKMYRSARAAWAQIAAVTTGVYVKDMTYGDAWFQRGHWADRLPAIDKDIAAMEAILASPTRKIGEAVTPEKIAALVQIAQGEIERPIFRVTHMPPRSFRRGAAVALTFTPANGETPPKTAQLYYRHTDQAETWNVIPMPMTDATTHAYRAEIPAAYTDSPYALTYYFELTDNSGGIALHPGFDIDLANSPYFTLRQAQPGAAPAAPPAA